MSDGTGFLLRELARERKQNAELRRKLRNMTKSRDYWREESRHWKWGLAHHGVRLSTPSTDLSPTERAEASGVV